MDRRYAVISELLRITKLGGTVMIQAWALEQGGDSKRIFETQDTMVPWRLSKRFFTEQHDSASTAPPSLTTKVSVADNNKEVVVSRLADVQPTCEPNEASSESVKTSATGVGIIGVNEKKKIKGKKIRSTEAATAASVEQEEANICAPVVLQQGDSGVCKHVVEEHGELVFQRYCHVYKEGELEGLCSSIPGCRIVESGWDRGNWFVQLEKVAIGGNMKCSSSSESNKNGVVVNDNEDQDDLQIGPEARIPTLATRL